MNNEGHEQHINGLLIIIAILVVGAILWFAVPHGQPATVPIVPATPTSQPTQSGTLYSNTQYSLSLRYGSDFALSTATDNANHSWSYNSTASGTRLFAITLPREFQPKTNFSSAEISFGASTDATAMKNCLTAQNGEIAQGVDNGFSVFGSSDAGAGNFYETTSRRMIKNGACTAVETVVHSTNIGNYDPSQGISEFDHAAVQSEIDAVIESVVVK